MTQIIKSLVSSYQLSILQTVVRPINKRIFGHEDLYCYIGGYIKGGTTLFKDILVASGLGGSCFELGALIPSLTGNDFKINEVILSIINDWGCARKDLLNVLHDSNSLYRWLRLNSDFYHYKDLPIIDKYPEYMMYLPALIDLDLASRKFMVVKDQSFVMGSMLSIGTTFNDAIKSILFSSVGLILGIAMDYRNSIKLVKYSDIVDEPNNLLKNTLDLEGASIIYPNDKAYFGTPFCGSHEQINSARESASFDLLDNNQQCKISQVLEKYDEIICLITSIKSGKILPKVREECCNFCYKYNLYYQEEYKTTKKRGFYYSPDIHENSYR